MSSKNSSRMPYKNPLINDLVKNASVLIVMHMLMNSRAGKPLITEDGLYHTMSFLVGLVFYWTVAANVIAPLE
jgi:hypothetical protein